MELTNLSTIKELAKKYNFNFSKSMGQNFLVNPSVCPKIAEDAVISNNTGVIEIGCGFGVLTKELAKRAKKVVVIELDTSLLPVIEETLSEFDNIKIINADILKTDIKKVIEDNFNGEDITIAANLPYYITSEIITTLLESKLSVKKMTFMVQKEAAVRFCADFKKRESGAITFCVRYYSEPKILFNVSRNSFFPAPNVDSAVITFDIREYKTKPQNEKLMFSLIKSAFIKRRKTILNSLSSFCENKEKLKEALNSVQIEETLRPENMDLEDFIKISDMLENIK